MNLPDLFTLLVYQPFFNILVVIYYFLGLFTQGQPDMGVAVILLTIVIRILLMPMSLSGDKSEKERREIAEKAQEIEEVFVHDPIALSQHKKLLFRRNRGVVAGELFSLVVQVGISLMLWRIFATGLAGEDFHLLYPFIPQVTEPFNLVFLGQFDLSHTSLGLNLIQSILIFVLETIAIYTSPYPPAKGEVVRLQLVLPVVSFFIFMFLPAGKKLFVIVTLLFSIGLIIYKVARRRYEAYKLDQEAKEAAALAGELPLESEKVVVEVK